MKTRFLIFILSIALISCKQEKLEKTFTPRALNSGESFNEFPKDKNDALKIAKVDSGSKAGDLFVLKFRDTAILIKDDPKPLATKFYHPRFMNSQKTAALIQVADSSGLVSPFFIVSVKDGKPEVIKLDRPSTGANDRKVTAGLQELSLSTVLINNDYIVTLINGKIYPVKRQNDAERIQGTFLYSSDDRKTLIFATANSLYQTNYITGEAVNLPVPASILDPATVVKNVQQNYHFRQNSKGGLFLEKNDDDKIVDISEFKK